MRCPKCLLSLFSAMFTIGVAFSAPVSHSPILSSPVTRHASRAEGIDIPKAKRYFSEAKQAAEDDGGKLWGVDLSSPMLFFDPRTGDAVANQADGQGKLTPQEGVFVGKVPNDFVGANTSMEWSGVYWTVVMWPLPDSIVNRTRLMMHECWHHVQSKIGLPPSGPKNEHLNMKDGRIWLILETRALQRALPAWGKKRKAALEDALAFRAYRQSLFPGSKEQEDRMEVHEGMAEYTGYACSGLSNNEDRYYQTGRLELVPVVGSLSYAFAYYTGPVYGDLLDEDRAEWRKGLSPSSSLADLLAKAEKIDLGKPNLGDVLRRSKSYDGDVLIAAETERENKRLAQLKVFQKEFVDGPVLVLPMSNFSFDPNNVTPFPGHGTVYSECKVTGDWGVLQVSGSVLVTGDYKTAILPAPKGPSDMKGEGWTLQLNPGWKLVPGSRSGDMVAVKP